MSSAGPSLLTRLPPVRGQLFPEQPLAKYTWFRVGGPAEVLFKPADEDDLAAFLAETPRDVPVTVLGVGSNLLVRDGGVRGVVIRLGSAFSGVNVRGTTITAGAAALDMKVAQAACEARLTGLEFLSGIPGTIGGAVVMNAGAYSQEVSDVLMKICALDRDGKRHTLSADELGLSYRHSELPDGWIILSVEVQGEIGDQAQIAAQMTEIKASRETSQPVRLRTGGSTFANPDGARAWELIDRAGCRGLMLGGAQVSEKHCNFLLNTGEATATELEALGELVRGRVEQTSGVVLRWEIRRIGDLPSVKKNVCLR